MEKQNTGGIGFFGLLTIVLITLKLIDIINWSWWLVLLPMIVVHVVGFAGAVIIVAIKYNIKKKRNECNADRRVTNCDHEHGQVQQTVRHADTT